VPKTRIYAKNQTDPYRAIFNHFAETNMAAIGRIRKSSTAPGTKRLFHNFVQSNLGVSTVSQKTFLQFPILPRYRETISKMNIAPPLNTQLMCRDGNNQNSNLIIIGNMIDKLKSLSSLFASCN